MTILLHEVHRLVGRREDDFERRFRDDWAPAVAREGDAALCWFLHHALGTGTSYTVVTVTALADRDAWWRHTERVLDGDLAPVASGLDECRRDVTGKLLVPTPWSPLRTVDPADVPARGDGTPTLFMEDTAWPYAGGLDAYLAAVREHYQPQLAEGGETGSSMLELLAVLRPAPGSARRQEVVLWQRVRDVGRLGRLLTTEIPPERRAPGTWMHDALAVRDDWESRLLRSAPWSPLH